MLNDGYREKGLRQQLVNEIKKKGITDSRIIDAIGKIPRHLFMDSAFVNFAYVDKAFPIGSGQTISQPYTVAFQTELLDIKKGDKVLEIGTGSGYQTAVLMELGAKVFTIERQRELFLKAQRFLPTYGPFDKILITAGAPEVPPVLLEQLTIGGYMVIPFGITEQTMLRITKTSESDYTEEQFGTFCFVPLLKGTAND
jgi:protein-L-isoaspartate(D-aspartate) O-methyltransferase